MATAPDRKRTIDMEPEDVSEAKKSADDTTPAGETSDADRKVQFLSSDKVLFDISVKAARKFHFAKLMMEQFPDSDDPIPVDKIESDVLAIMIKWAEYHADDPESEDRYDPNSNEVRRSDDIGEWDKELIQDIDTKMLFRLTHGANFSQMNGFMATLLKKLANMIKGKNPEDIRKAFGLDEAPSTPLHGN